MNYVLKPSLGHMALTKIVVTLWNQDDVRALMKNFLESYLSFHSELNHPIVFSAANTMPNEWMVIEDKVLEKVPELLLPELLNEKILNFISVIGLEILNWLEYHDQYLHDGRDLPNEFCWTSQGTVDKRKTAEALIKNENLDIESRYKLGCVYCLENDILKLWAKMPENLREKFYSKEGSGKFRQQELVDFWIADIIKRDESKVDKMIERRLGRVLPSYKHAFEHAACYGNKAAAEYFFLRLTHEERKVSLVKCAMIVAHYKHHRHFRFARLRFYLGLPNVLCFLLSQMDSEQQIEVFKSEPLEVLVCFLVWPWQSLFREMASRTVDFFSNVQYSHLFNKILDKVTQSYKDYDYQKLFGEVLQQSPDTYKKYVIAMLCVNTEGMRSVPEKLLFVNLLKIGDKENITLFLKSATVKEREEILFSYLEQGVCEHLMDNNKWDFLKLFIQECISSKEVMIKFKESRNWIFPGIQNYVDDHTRDMHDKFHQFLDSLIQENNRRSLEENYSTLAKNFHSIA